jgi:signal transduction histidine kinase
VLLPDLSSAVLSLLVLLPAGLEEPEPWWRSRWAAIALVFVLGTAVAGVGRWRMGRLFARQAELEQAIQAAVRDLAAANRELEARNQALRRLNDVKSEFLGAAAHDLKNPLGVVMGLSEILIEQLEDMRAREPALAAEVIERAGLIRTSAEHMSVLVGQLLDTVALESGQVRLRPQRVDVSSLAAAVVDAHRPRAAVKRIALDLETRGPCSARLDPDRAWEILDNLVSNALKFSPSGSRVWVRVAPRDGGGVGLEVKDEGPGLTAADRERVFGRFQRLSARPTGGESSTGLGLSIVKTLVELHGGAIGVESEPGAGATFAVDLPDLPAPRDGA